MEKNSKIGKYEEFLNSVLKEDLRKEIESRENLYERIAAHSQLKQTVECIKESDLKDGLRTQIDLGSNFYTQAHIPDPSKIFVKIGLDVHLEMSLREAADYCEKKVKILTEEVGLSTKRSAEIKGKIRFVELALREIQGLGVVEEEQPRRNLLAL